MEMTGEGSWTDQHDGVCVTLVRGMAPAELITVLCGQDVQAFAGADQAAAWVRSSESYHRTWLAVGMVDDWGFAWEDNGFQGADPGVLHQPSAGTTAVSVFGNVNSVMTFTLAEPGHIVRQFDPLSHDDDPGSVAEIGQRVAEESGLSWQSAPRLGGLRLQARLAQLDDAKPEWLSRTDVSV